MIPYAIKIHKLWIIHICISGEFSFHHIPKSVDFLEFIFLGQTQDKLQWVFEVCKVQVLLFLRK